MQMARGPAGGLDKLGRAAQITFLVRVEIATSETSGKSNLRAAN